MVVSERVGAVGAIWRVVVGIVVEEAVVTSDQGGNRVRRGLLGGMVVVGYMELLVLVGMVLEVVGRVI